MLIRGGPEPSPLDAPVEPASTTLTNEPNITSSTTWGPLEPELVEPGCDQVAVEGEATSRGMHHDTFSVFTHLNR